MSEPNGYLAFVLHAHLPYVRHPEHDEFLEEDWLFEAVTETYIPLLDMLAGFERDGIAACFTMSITPPLCEMLADPLLQERYSARIQQLHELAGREVGRTTGKPEHVAACMYRSLFEKCVELFELKWNRNLVRGFRHFQDAGFLEIVTCPATHGFLPLMVSENAVRAQLRVARANYRKHFGREPRGLWPAECAYAPGLDRYFREEGFDYFFADTHGVSFGRPRPRHGPFRPVVTPHGVAVFARDPESSKQVWSSQEGYPGDFRYREFYRDLGYDGAYEYIREYLHNDGIRRDLGLKYHKITGRVGLHEKQFYDPEDAERAVCEHAGNFMFNRQHQVRGLRGMLGVKPLIISPYDAELFGHWWFEGPRFLDVVMRRIACDQHDVKLTTPSRFLEKYPEHQQVEPCGGSWGDKGYNEVWLNGANDWIYRHLHAAEVHMCELARRFPYPDPLRERALKQAARELLLAQASDWAFILTTGTMVGYAERRTRDHLHRFNGLYLQLIEDRLEEPWLKELEWKDSIFQEIDYRVFT